MVEYVAGFQPEEEDEVTWSVVDAVRLICRNAIQVHASMRDSASLGEQGSHFRAFAYLQVQYLVMYREVYDAANAEQCFWLKSERFAVKARGCPAMSSRSGTIPTNTSKSATKIQPRCLICGKLGRRANSEVHQAAMAEGAEAFSPEKLRQAVARITQDASLTAEKQKQWSGRIKAFWATLRANGRDTEVS